MDVKNVTPFIVSFNIVMKQLGFVNIRKGILQAKKKTFTGSDIIIIVGMAGELKGNVIYVMDIESAKKIASVVMKGAPVNKLDGMVKSALGELANMLTAHASTAFSAMKILIQISTPACFEGRNMEITMNSDKVLCIQMFADDIPIDVNISFER